MKKKILISGAVAVIIIGITTGFIIAPMFFSPTPL